MKIVVCEDPCPTSGQSMQKIIDKLLCDTDNSKKLSQKQK